MSALAKLKLTSIARTNKVNPVVQRRLKVIARIDEQIALNDAEQAGQQLNAMRQRKVKDEDTGEIRLVQVPKRVRNWAWTAENGKTCVSLFYGSKVVAIDKNKATIELASKADLAATLVILRSAVESGELDVQLETASGAARASFKK